MANQAALPAPVPRELAKSVLPAYFVQPGDILLIESTNLDTFLGLPGDQTIFLDGTIDLGVYGRIVVAGMTLEEIEAAAKHRIESIEQQEIAPLNVRLVESQSAVYYVLGEVNAPGAYPLSGRETVLDAILMAGGVTDSSSACDIVLSRPTAPGSCRVVLPVCLTQVVQLGDSTTNYQIMPGDRIFVGTKRIKEQLRFGSQRCSSCGGIQCVCPSPITSFGPEFVAPPSTETMEVLESDRRLPMHR